MTEKKKKNGGFSKRKGGAYERKVAKELSEWMFDGNPDILKRHPTSGADKCIWSGDIVPLAQLPDSWNKRWPFYIECKTGYEQHFPDLISHKKIEEWFMTACFQSAESNHGQNIIYLIAQFKHKKPILFTNRWISKPLAKSILPVNYIYNNQNYIMWIYTYDYHELRKCLFHDLYNLQEIVS